MNLKRKVDVEKIRRIRKSKRLTMTDMSERLGYESPTGYAHLEHGNARFPAAMLAEVADILEVSMEELMMECCREKID